MPRPPKRRFIASEFGIRFFGPKGVPMMELEVNTVTHDEAEALRLSDYDGLYHEQAAEEMGVSRATFGRIIASARKKMVDALINGKAIQVDGGSYAIGRSSYGCRYWQGGRKRWGRRWKS